MYLFYKVIVFERTFCCKPPKIALAAKRLKLPFIATSLAFMTDAGEKNYLTTGNDGWNVRFKSDITISNIQNTKYGSQKRHQTPNSSARGFSYTPTNP